MSAYEDLLNAFIREIPSRPERPPTFMEISGYPHYENVCSNILAFFFDPKKPHGLGTLFLDAIARVGSIEDQGGATSGEITVEREVQTDAGNYIDMVLKSDSHAILIENKIYAGTDNPLPDYAAHLDKCGRKYNYKFLLTLRPVSTSDGFQNITHAQVVKEIRGLLGCYVAGADTRYLTLMLDFLNTLDYLHGGKIMNPELVEFLNMRSRDVESFLKDINAFREELRHKIKGLGSLITMDSCSNVTQYKWRERSGISLSDILVHDIEVPQGFVIAVDTVLSPSGWAVKVFPRKKKHDRATQDLLKSLQIQADKKNGKYVLPVRFEYTADLSMIAPEITKVVEDIAGSTDVS